MKPKAYPCLESLADVRDLALSKLSDRLLAARVVADHVELDVPPVHLLKVLEVLKDGPAFACKHLLDIAGVDYPHRTPRFSVVYHVLSLKWNHRVRVITTVPEGSPLPSVTRLFSCANWLEREVWDMFGIPFEDHPDLRRILMDPLFDGHPLRKDFPLSGHVELRYDEDAGQIVSGPVRLTQPFRDFDFTSPWEGVAHAVRPTSQEAES